MAFSIFFVIVLSGVLCFLQASGAPITGHTHLQSTFHAPPVENPYEWCTKDASERPPAQL